MREFVYLPIESADVELAKPAPTYRELGFPHVSYPDLPVHLDPEFETATYGHVTRGFGDSVLWALQPGDLLYFYATLDLLPSRRKWGVYIIGYFAIDHVQDTRWLEAPEIRSLKPFAKNAHLKEADPRRHLHLLVKGSTDSRLYTHAIELSDPEDNWRLHPNFAGLLTTPSGKALTGVNGWWRWVHCSQEEALASLLRGNG